MSRETGWELNYRTHFDDIVTEYERIRPGWPRVVFRDIFAYCGADCGKNAVEIGAGTGKATYHFLDNGYSVTAVEIGVHMAQYLRARFAANDKFSVVVSSFEDAALAEGVYDLVYAASSFHWVDARIGAPKAYRLLKPRGVIALFRYNNIAPERDELHDALQDIYIRHYHAYYDVPYRAPERKTHADFLKPEEIYKGFKLNDLRDYGFTDTQMKFCDATLTYTTDEHIAFLNTLSDHRNMPDDKRRAFHAEIRDMIQAHGGVIKQDYVFQLYMGRKS